MGVKMVSFDELVITSDFISVHAPLTKQTRHMFGAAQFKAMKNSAYLINCARGGLVDSAALYDALVAGELSGAALDVTEPEPLPVDHKLLSLPNVIVTCHTVANSDESYIDCQTHAAREVANVLSGKGPTTEIKDPCCWPKRKTRGSAGCNRAFAIASAILSVPFHSVCSARGAHGHGERWRRLNLPSPSAAYP